MKWTYGPGQVPKFLSVKVYRKAYHGNDYPFEKTLPEGFNVSDPGSMYAEVSVNAMFEGDPIKVVFTGNSVQLAGKPLGGQQDEFVGTIALGPLQKP